MKPEIIKNPDQNAGDAVGIYQPTGIIYQIEPWNAPYFQIVRPMSATLMAGNVMVLKHASNVPQCALAMEKLMRDAGAPEGVFTNLFVSYEQSDRVIADPRVTGVTITGSTEVGRGVAAIKGNEFIYQLLVKMDEDGYWRKLSCGSTFESLNSDNIFNAEIIIPDIEEQKRIGSYFQQLDNLITLHQRKLEVLNKLKKAMLQNMFV